MCLYTCKYIDTHTRLCAYMICRHIAYHLYLESGYCTHDMQKDILYTYSIMIRIQVHRHHKLHSKFKERQQLVEET